MTAPKTGPANWRLVPVEPTPEHYEGYLERPLLQKDKAPYKRWAADYRDIVRAAPTPPPDDRDARIAVLEQVLRELLDVLDVCRVVGSQKNVERSVKAQRAARAALTPPEPQQDRTEEAGR